MSASKSGNVESGPWEDASDETMNQRLGEIVRYEGDAERNARYLGKRRTRIADAATAFMTKAFELKGANAVNYAERARRWAEALVDELMPVDPQGIDHQEYSAGREAFRLGLPMPSYRGDAYERGWRDAEREEGPRE